MNREIIAEFKTNETFDYIIYIICFLLIIRVVYFFNVNPLGATCAIFFLLLFILIMTQKRITLYKDRIKFTTFRCLKLYRKEYVVKFKDILKTEFDKPGVFYPAYFITGWGATKQPSYIFYFKDGTSKKLVMYGNNKKIKALYLLMLDMINKQNNKND